MNMEFVGYKMEEVFNDDGSLAYYQIAMVFREVDCHEISV